MKERKPGDLIRDLEWQFFYSPAGQGVGTAGHIRNIYFDPIFNVHERIFEFIVFKFKGKSNFEGKDWLRFKKTWNECLLSLSLEDYIKVLKYEENLNNSRYTSYS